MKILVFHNLLWSQYKSVIFEELNHKISILENSKILVVQTAITEKSRIDLVDFDINTFPFDYDFKLISKKPLESVNSLWIGMVRFYYILKFKPDIINLTGYNELSTFLILIFCKFFKIKSIITNESIRNNFEHKNFIYYLKFYFKVGIFKLTDGFFSYGIKSNSYLFEHQVPKNKIYSFLNTFDKKSFLKKLSANTFDFKYFLFVGRLSEEKNISELINLFEKIKNSCPDYKLLIIGNGPDKQNLIEKIRNKNLESGIQLIGSIMWKDLSNYYANAECLILPSLIEPWGMVANESLELNTPVIATSNCGCSDDLIINNYNGLIVDDITDTKNINSIIEFIKTNKLKISKNFIANNSKIFNLERLCWEMMNGYKNVTKN